MTEVKKTKVKLTRSAKGIAARRKGDSERLRMISPVPSVKAESKPLKSVCAKATLRDCICGQAVGDALGVPYEFKSRDSFECAGMDGYGTHDQPAGTWSDDTSMALAICDSYRELKRIDINDIREKFVSWFRDGAYTCDGLFDIGNATAEALRIGHGLAGEWDNGNGSLMRTIPLAFVDAADDEIRAVSAITHAHPTSTEACVAMVGAARPLLRVRPLEKWLWFTVLNLINPGPKYALVAMCLIRSKLRCGALQIRRITVIACSLPSILETIRTRRAQLLELLPVSFTVLRESQPNGSTL